MNSAKKILGAAAMLFIALGASPLAYAGTAVDDNPPAISEGGAIAPFNVGANDTPDPFPIPNTPPNFVIVTPPSHAASFSLLINGTLNYTHDGTENFTDSLTYRFTQVPSGPSNTATVTFTINPVNDNTPTITSPTTLSVNENVGTGTIYTITENDTDLPGDTFTYSIVGGNDNGDFNINTTNGQISFISDPDAENPDDQNTDNDYEIRVQVNDGLNDSLVQDVTITVDDVNDVNPVITAAQSFDIAENAANSSSVGTPLATDGDVSATTFSSWTETGGGTGAAFFQINSSTGEITVQNNASFDADNAPTSYTYEITVSDGLNTSAAQTVTINLTDVNDINPVITAAQSFDIAENAANSSSVGTPLATDGDATATTFSSWTETGGGDGAAFFQINSGTGEITVQNNASFDFDTAPTSYTYEITVSDGLNTSAAQTVTINLTDVNDINPVITAAQSFDIAENAANSSSVGTPLATDGDATATTFSSWTETGGGDGAAFFQINSGTGEITVQNNASFDFDTAPTSYTYEITVSDGVNTSAAQTVTINLTDVNDINPVITAAQSFDIAENAANSSSVGTPLATDADATATTFSSWTETGGGTGAAFFQINSGTGEITVQNNASFDADNAPTSYTYEITVSDGVNTSAAQTVTINLTDVNDINPVITAAQSFDIAENIANSASVGTPVATDGDATATTFSSWTETGGGDGAAFFQINSGTGEITVQNNASFDFDTAPTSYTYEITVSDGVNTSAAQTVTINLTDVNDINPVITAAQTFDIAENIANSASVGTPVATDGDATATTFSSWTETGGGDGAAFFQINSGTGEITVQNNASFDFDTAPTSYTYEITVSDGVNTSAAQTVTINLTDVNDINPVITAAQSFDIAENAANSSSVGTPLATDADVSATTFSAWTETGGGDGAAFFQINSGTGEITVQDNASFDADTAPTSYTYEITVSDGVNTSAAQTVTINLTDINDINPIITAAQSFDIAENIANSASVGTPVATDADATATTFSAWTETGGGTGAAFFQINSGTGEITVQNNASFDFDTAPTSYTYEITVSDGTNTSAAQTVTINLTDINDIDPIITAAQSFDIAESIANSASVGTPVATDADVTPTTFSAWTETGGGTGAGFFQINAGTGEITVQNNASFDFDTAPTSYTYEITVSDGTNTSAAQTVTINLTDINDINPIITAAQSFDIAENIANSASVGTPIATDADVTPTTFSAWTETGGGTGAGFFQINAGTGEITVQNNASFDFDTAPTSYTYEITVSDGTNTSAAQTVTINLTDINDIDPIITAAQSFDIAENIANSASVGTPLATDADATATTFSAWTETGGGTGAAFFQINAGTGEITVQNNGSFDADTAPTSYTYEITVSDGTNTSAAQTVTINLTDINDIDPIITAAQSFDIAENIANSASVGTPVATDADVTATTFSAWTETGGGTGAGFFQINAGTGEITVQNNASFDFDTAPTSYTYEITVSDGTNTSAAQTVTINLTDINDIDPIITAAQSFDIAENIANSASVGTPVATDADVTPTTFSAWTETGGGTGAGFFQINAGTGEITVQNNASFDFDTAPTSYTYEITVSDGTNTSAAQTVTINLTDINDINPIITAAQSFDIAENIANSASVGTPVATDADVTATTFSAWTETGGGTGAAFFQINAATGEITVQNNASFDFDTAPTSYTYEITVSDGTNTSAAETVTINLTDVNDINPIITAAQSFNIAEDIANSANVGTPVATDADITATTFSAWTETGAGTGAGFFQINATTGQITVQDNSSFDFDILPQSYTYVITVSDGTNTSAAETVTINLTNVNEAPLATNLSDTVGYTEDDASVDLANIVVSDVDDDQTPQTITVNLTLNDINAGALTTSGSASYTSGTGVWTITDTLANVNTALAAVAFVPTADHDTNTTITTHVEDQGALGPADGTINLNVTAQNDAPLATNMTNTVGYTEDAASVALVDIVVSDVDDADFPQTITATLTLNDIAGGSLTTSGTATYTAGTGVWTITNTVANVNSALAAVAFVPAADYDTDTSITTAIDDQNSAGPANGLITLDVTPVNDAPLATNMTQNLPYTEDAASVAITDIVVSDVDDADVAQTITATLTLADTAAGTLSTSGTATYTVGTGVWTISDTVANVNSALASVAFIPAGDYDTDTSVSTAIEDQDSAGPANGTITLDVTPVNDPPLATNLTQNLPYTEDAATVAITDIVVSDVDDGDVAQTITATLTLADIAAGSLSVSGAATYTAGTGVWTITDNIANVNSALASVAFIPAADYDTDTTISTAVEDQDSAGPANGTITLDVTPVNDAPLATNMTNTVGYTEDDASVALVDIVVSDVDDADVPQTITATLTLNDIAAGSLSVSGTATYTAGTGVWTITDTVANVNSALASVAFVPVADYDTDTSITTAIEDQDSAGPANGTITLDVTPVNDAPLATNLTQNLPYTEDAASVAITDIVVSDVDDADVGQTITATLTLADNAAGTLSTSGTATYTAGTGVWTISDTVANVNSALAAVAFIPAGDYDTDTTISTQVEDQDSAGPANGTITLDVTPVNDAPLATNLTNTVTYTEDDASVALVDIVVSDVDDGDVAQTITATLTLNDIAAGSLTVSGGATYTAGTGVWTITDTVSNVNSALASVAFEPTADYDTDTTITTHVEDQDAAGPTDGTITLDVTPVNDAPLATNLTQNLPYTEDAATVAITDIVVTDVDDADVPQTITATLTLADTAAGSLTVSGTATYTAGTGVWTISDTVTNVNSALAAVAFVPAADYDSDTTVSTLVRDQDSAGPASGTITLDVTPVNDAPTATNLTDTVGYTEDDASVALADIVVSDVDDSDVGQTITATLTLNDTAAGSLTTSGTATYTVGTGVWTITDTLANVNSALASVAFIPAADYDTDTTITTHVEDQDVAGPVDGTITLDVTPVNDDPLATNLTQNLPYTEDAATVAITDIVVSDVDDADVPQTITATLTLADIAAGSLSVSGTATYTAGTGVWTITDSITNVNSALAAVAFIPAADYDTDTTISTLIRDQDSAGPAAGTITLDVTPVNDAPLATNLTQNLPYTEDDASVAITDIVVSDVDDSDVGQTITATLTLNDIAAGALSTSGTATYTPATGVWTISDTLANVNSALASVAFIPAADYDTDTTITTHVEDQDASGPADGTITLDVTPVNDAPLATNLTNTVGYTEDAATVALVDIVVSDVDDGDVPQTITATLTLNDTAAGSLTTSGTATYTVGTGVWTITDSITNVNSALAAVAFIPALNYDTDTTITTHVEDQDATGPADGTITLDVTPVNDAPLVTNLTQLKAYTEDDASVALDDMVITDVDDSDVSQTMTATLTLNDPAGGSLSTSGTATYTAGTGVWTITDSITNVNSALAAVAFIPAADYDTDTTITTHVEDQDAAGPADGTITLDVTPVNDAPTATNLTNTVGYTEDAGSVALVDIVVSDVDDNDVPQTITATLTLADAVNAGSLTTSGTATYTAGTGVWTITDTIANVNSALASVAFVPNADYDTDTSIATHVEDQDATGPTDGTITLDVTPVNDAPLATNLTQNLPYNEDDATVAITDIVVSDVDDADVTQTITATLTLNDIAAGVLTTSGTATYTGGTGVWTITDTVANVNSALAAVAFQPAANYDTDTTITTHVEDQDAAGPADGTITLDVTPSNDAPTATNLTVTTAYIEDNQTFVNLDNIVVSDVDDGDVAQTITATLTLADAANAGVLTTSGTATYTPATGVWTITDTLANVNAALAAVQFQPTADYDTDTTIATHVEDQAGSGPADGVITLDVTPVNDAPTATNTTFTITYDEDELGVDFDPAIVISDVDDADVAQTITVTLSPSSYYPVTFIDTGTFNPGTGEWTVTGTLAAVNTALAGLRFNAVTNWDVDTTMTLLIMDQDTAVVNGSITMDVVPANDPPVVNDQTFNVDENAINGTVVGTVIATNVEVVQTLSYALTGTAFDIDPVTGQITVSNSAELDREALAEFTPTVTVTDDGTPIENDTATITIELNPLNDNSPSGVNDVVSVDEGAVLNFNVLTEGTDDFDADLPAETLTVSEVDGDPAKVGVAQDMIANTKVVGSLVINSDGSATFTASSDITVEEFQVIQTYTVTDGTFEDTGVTVTINVNPINDNDPVITAAGAAIVASGITYDEDEYPTSVPTVLTLDMSSWVLDLDIDSDGLIDSNTAEDNDSLVFTVQSNSNSALVDANISDTDLTVSSPFNEHGTSNLVIRVTDTALPLPNAFVDLNITVTVNSENDPPIYVDGSYSNMTVDEDSADIEFPLEDAFTDVDIDFDSDPSDDSHTYTITVVDDPAIEEVASVYIDLPFTKTSETIGTPTGGRTTVYETTNDNFTIQLEPDAHGTLDITVRATDAGNPLPVLLVEESFTITVQGIGDDTPTAIDYHYNDYPSLIMDEDSDEITFDVITPLTLAQKGDAPTVTLQAGTTITDSFSIDHSYRSTSRLADGQNTGDFVIEMNGEVGCSNATGCLAGQSPSTQIDPSGISEKHIMYQPGLDYNGEDTFTYCIQDTFPAGEPAFTPPSDQRCGLITVLINPVNDLPRVPEDIIYTMDQADDLVVDEATGLKTKAVGVDNTHIDGLGCNPLDAGCNPAPTDPQPDELFFFLQSGTTAEGGTLIDPGRTDGSFTFRPSATFSGSDSFLVDICEASTPSVDVCIFGVPVTIVVEPIEGAPEGSSEELVENDFGLADIPLELPVGPEANVLIINDDSGSMRWDMLTTQSSGVYFFSTGHYILYTLKATNTSSTYVAPSEARRPGQGLWRLRNSEYSKTYYNPEIRYDPWNGLNPDLVDFPNADPEDALHNPLAPNGASTNLRQLQSYVGRALNGSGKFKKVTTNNFYIPRYYIWDDKDGDGNVDANPSPHSSPATSEGILVEIRPASEGGSDTYPRSLDRTDCVTDPTFCTYQEELQNFANWFTYSRNREYTAKSALGKVVAASENIRIGYGKLNSSSNQRRIESMNSSERTGEKKALLDAIYLTGSSGGTPLRRALRDGGRHFECRSGDIFNVGSNSNPGDANCPIFAAPAGNCQQNFALLISDGAWNGGSPSIGDADNPADPDDQLDSNFDEGVYTSTPDNTLADVAMHYYERDLHTLANEVPTSARDIDGAAVDAFENDENVLMHQHMKTYTVGFGVNGLIDPDDVPTDYTQSFNWGNPFSSTVRKIDDMLHAAVNGRGEYLSAGNASSLAAALVQAFSEFQQGSGAASAVSFNSQEILEDTLVFRSFYNTKNNTGDLLAQSIDENGVVEETPTWNAAARLDLVEATDREIITFDRDPDSTTYAKGIPFRPASLNDDQRALFISDLGAPQAQQDLEVNQRVAYLRGDDANERPTGNFRERPGVEGRLGDIVHSAPTFIGPPSRLGRDVEKFPQTDLYSTFKTANELRDPMVYVASNDGMIHGFDARTGDEKIGYVPDNLMTKTYSRKITELLNYEYSHKYFVDSTPAVNDVYMDADGDGDKEWRTILVNGQGAGAKAYVALDITDPTKFGEDTAEVVALWEFTDDDDAYPTDSAGDPLVDADDNQRQDLLTPALPVKDLGYSFSVPSIVMSNLVDPDGEQKWVALAGNGYNSTAGIAKLFVLFLEGGIDGIWCHPDMIHNTVLDGPLPSECVGKQDFVKLDTGFGVSTDGVPNGLGEPRAIDVDGNGTADYAYAGDMQGNFFRFDITDADHANWTVTKIFKAQYKPGTVDEKDQPITTQPIAIVHPTEDEGFIIIFGTGAYLRTDDATDPNIQTIYGIWDRLGPELILKSELQPQSYTNLDDDLGLVRLLSDNPVDYSTVLNQKGWFIDLDSPPPGQPAGSPAQFPGEKAVRNIQLRGGLTFTSSVFPREEGSCVGRAGGAILSFCPDTGGSLCFGNRTIFDLNNDGAFDDDDDVGTDDDLTAAGIILEDPTPPTDSTFIGDQLVTQQGTDLTIIGTNTSSGSNTGRLSWKQIQTVPNP